MKILPKLDFYSQPLLHRMNGCSFSVPHRTVLRPILPTLCTQHSPSDVTAQHSSF